MSVAKGGRSSADAIRRHAAASGAWCKHDLLPFCEIVFFGVFLKTFYFFSKVLFIDFSRIFAIFNAYPWVGLEPLFVASGALGLIFVDF